MPTYEQVKATVVDVIDDFTRKDLVADYKPNGRGLYSAKTRLASLAINEAILAVMPIRFNKAMKQLCGPGLTEVGAFDLVQKSTIVDLIWLGCAISNTQVPPGEPT